MSFKCSLFKMYTLQIFSQACRLPFNKNIMCMHVAECGLVHVSAVKDSLLTTESSLQPSEEQKILLRVEPKFLRISYGSASCDLSKRSQANLRL